MPRSIVYSTEYLWRFSEPRGGPKKTWNKKRNADKGAHGINIQKARIRGEKLVSSVQQAKQLDLD